MSIHRCTGESYGAQFKIMFAKVIMRNEEAKNKVYVSIKTANKVLRLSSSTTQPKYGLNLKFGSRSRYFSKHPSLSLLQLSQAS